MIALALALFLTAAPQEGPPACEIAPGVATDWAACAEALPEGSPQQRLARLNQATEAYLNRDYGAAERLYDAVAGDEEVYSDVWLHTFRGDTYQQVGRDKDAVADARIAWLILSDDPAWEAVRRMSGEVDEDTRRFLLSLILPILKKGRDDTFEAAFAAYRALPVKDVDGHANLALVLEQLGDFNGALEASLVAVKAEPTNPGYLNNHCYILVRAGRPAEGLPFCEKAVQGAPDVAPIRHSLAAALAGAGRCDEAEAALAEARRLDPATVLYRQPIACSGS
ncbi:MAG: tetratricopeptide repeat protein [Brevundimonas sp.]|nr:tetratricopeptide repeat protein [Brevundimonas sp.]